MKNKERNDKTWGNITEEVRTLILVVANTESDKGKADKSLFVSDNLQT